MSSFSSLSSSISAVPSHRIGSGDDVPKSNRSVTQEKTRGQKREHHPSAESASSSSRSSIRKVRRDRGGEQREQRERKTRQTPLSHVVIPSSSKARMTFPQLPPTRVHTPRPSSRKPDSLYLMPASPGHDLSDLQFDSDRKSNRDLNRNSSSTPLALKFREYAAVTAPPDCNEAFQADADATTFRSSSCASGRERPIQATGFQAHQSITASRSSAHLAPQVPSGVISASFSSPRLIPQVPVSPPCSTLSLSLTSQRHFNPATARLLRNTPSSLVRQASTSSLRTSAIPSLSSSFSESPSTPSPHSRVLDSASPTR